MNAYNPIEGMDRLTDAGIQPAHAKAFAHEMIRAIDDRVTKTDLEAALYKQALAIIGTLGAIVVGATAILGVILSN